MVYKYSHDKTSFEGSAIEIITSPAWITSVDKWTYTFISKFFLVYWLNIYITAKFCSWIRCSPSLHPSSHHQIIFDKFNLKIYYPHPYLREVWHYKEANVDLIKRAISNFNWEKAFSKANINEKVSLFNKTILSILNNYIPHKPIIYDDKDPPWFNSRLNRWYKLRITFAKIIKDLNLIVNYWVNWNFSKNNYTSW